MKTDKQKGIWVMRFPLWHYLNQPLLDKKHPLILNPAQYWQRYQIRYLNRCLNNAFLETCWRVNYQRFVIHYKDFCSRNALEEDPRWFVERCWAVERRPRTYQHPEH